jgi:DegV family protein with EDD domain
MRAAVLGRGKPGIYNLAGPGQLTIKQLAEELGWHSVPVPSVTVDAVAELVGRLGFLPAQAQWIAAFREPVIMSAAKARRELRSDAPRDDRRRPPALPLSRSALRLPPSVNDPVSHHTHEPRASAEEPRAGLEDPRAGVAIVTDSTPYLPAELIERLRVQQVSLYVGWEGDLRPEHEYADLDDFYARLRDSPQLPTTSQPSVGDFLSCYQPLVSAGRDVLSVHIAGGLSGTCESAREAARIVAEEQKPGKVEVLDSQTGAGGLGCLVVVAAGAAEAGGALDEVAQAVHRARESLDIWFCLDTLEYLRRGGRIGAAQAMVGSALKVKPILTFGTEIAPVGRVRTHRRAFERMVGYLSELHDRGATDWIVQHAQAPEDAERLVAEGTAIFSSAPLFCTEVGPVLGAHLGAGMLVGGMTRPALEAPPADR